MSRELKGWSRPRPLRVAFLVQDGEHADLALDGIFADCYSRWGGRFSLIVPCLNGRITSSYWAWLEAYDPDIVYSYVPLNKVDILEVHERLSPAQYTFHELDRESKVDAFGFKPSYGFTPLSSLSTIFRLARYKPTSDQPAPVKIIDSWYTERSTRFLTDNFGTYFQSWGTSAYPPDATSAATLLTIVAPERQADRRFGVPHDLDAIPSEMAALAEFAERRATSLSLVSAMFAPKLEISGSLWSETFNLVVGDSFTDRILFWNARLLIPAWLDADLCCLRVEFEQLANPSFVAALGNLLKRNRVNNGVGGQPQLMVRSTSLSADQLVEAHEIIMSTKPWGMAWKETVNGIDGVTPSVRALQNAREGNRFGGELFSRPEWTHFVWQPPIARPSAVMPDHLSDAPVRQSFAQGHWCTDFVFEYDGPGSLFAEVNRWMLPRRWRMASAFKMSFGGRPQHALPPPVRRSRDGNLAVFVSADHPVETIRVPTPREAMEYALTADGAWVKPDAEHGQLYPPTKALWVEPSNEARYLTGVLGMTGGLRRAEQFLLHPFLQENFAKLGGTPNLPADKLGPTVDRVRKRAQRETAFDLRSERERQALAGLILKAARTIKNPKNVLSYDELKRGWQTYRAAYWVAHPRQGNPGPDVDWDKSEEVSLDNCLVELRRRQMIFQGHQWTCQKCHHRNWVDFAALAPQLPCEVCKEPTQAPIDIRWLFRPNEFLIESLRDHSALSLIWALSALRKRSRRSFIFVEPMWFGFTRGSASPDAEADLFALLDGQAMLCEVKSSWHSLRPAHLAEFAALASRLRPDIALLAVMEAGPGPLADIAAARARLAAEQIEFEILTLDQHMPDDHPYLHYDGEE
ncbi:MAG: hypothetical protein ACOY3L_15085 [Pseudomonadota bacterium]